MGGDPPGRRGQTLEWEKPSDPQFSSLAETMVTANDLAEVDAYELNSDTSFWSLDTGIWPESNTW